MTLVGSFASLAKLPIAFLYTVFLQENNKNGTENLQSYYS